MENHATRNQYDISPKVICSGKETAVCIRGLYPTMQFTNGETYKVHVFAMDSHGERKRSFDVVAKDGCLTWTYTYMGEQEYLIYVGAVKKTSPRFNVYVVKEDLYSRFAYKGDLHMHSNRSDGQDDPAYVACASRRVGYDFIALTDHNRYAPSLEQIAAFEGAPLDLEIYRGEEVHPDTFGEKEIEDVDTVMHFLSINGSFGVTDLPERDKEGTEREIYALAESLPDLGEGINRMRYAKALWVAKKAREAGALSVLCHIYWVRNYGYYMDMPLVEKLLDEQVFDAYEMISGYDPWDTESNLLQVTKYYEHLAKGNRLSIVGVSDEHGVENDKYFGWYYTIVFAPSTAFEDVAAAIKAGYSVAVEQVQGESLRIYGEYRFVKFAMFLAREVFPTHDKLCVREGDAMEEFIAKGDAVRLADYKGTIAQYLKKTWGK